LEQVVQAAANSAVNQANVTFGPPTARSGQVEPQVNICLFRVAPNAAQRNAYLPSRSSSGDPMRRSRIALDLHFLLSFYGDPDVFEPERLFGAVALALEHQPLLSKSNISAAIASHSPELEGADLADASGVRITLDTISLDDFTKVWSVFFQVPYVLSAAYTCSHIVVETETQIAPALPVTKPLTFVSPLAQLALERAAAAPGAVGGIVWNGPLWITGKGLAKAGLRFSIDGIERPVAETSGGNAGANAKAGGGSAVKILLTPANFAGTELSAGTHLIEALAPAAAGAPAHLVQRSNVLAFALHPTITLAADAATVTASSATRRTGTLQVGFAPRVAATQQVRLFLDNRDPNKPSKAVLERKAPQPGSAPAAVLTFPFSQLEAGSYLVRAEVDRVPSLPTTNQTPGADFGNIVGPVLVLP
jgi:hypothetical protein